MDEVGYISAGLLTSTVYGQDKVAICKCYMLKIKSQKRVCDGDKCHNNTHIMAVLNNYSAYFSFFGIAVVTYRNAFYSK